MYQISEVRKALVPLVVAAILAVLGAVGIAEDMTVGEAITFVVLSALTFLVPNKKK